MPNIMSVIKVHFQSSKMITPIKCLNERLLYIDLSLPRGQVLEAKPGFPEIIHNVISAFYHLHSVIRLISVRQYILEYPMIPTTSNEGPV